MSCKYSCGFPYDGHSGNYFVQSCSYISCMDESPQSSVLLPAGDKTQEPRQELLLGAHLRGLQSGAAAVGQQG